MPRKTFARLLLACTLAFPALAQTAAEQLQKGIFAQDTQGKLDDAIAIYRQIAASSTTPRDTAAQAQYRLAQALLQKGDIPNATRAFEQLERAFPDSGQLISQLASRLHAPAAGFNNPNVPESALREQITKVRVAMLAGEPITGSPIREYGRITQVNFENPSSTMKITTSTTDYLFILSSPSSMSQQGIKRDTFKAGDMVTINGIIPTISRDNNIGVANTIELASNGQVVFDRAKLPAGAGQPMVGGGRGGTGVFVFPPVVNGQRTLPANITHTVSGVVATHEVTPDYSYEAWTGRYQGDVVLALTVDTNGNPSNLRVTKRLGMGLDEKAMEALMQWKFAPPPSNGGVSQGMVTFNFRLQ